MTQLYDSKLLKCFFITITDIKQLKKQCYIHSMSLSFPHHNGVNLRHERDRRARHELGIEETFAITRHDQLNSLNRLPVPRTTHARISRVLLITLAAKLSRSHHPLSPVNDCGPYKLREDEVSRGFHAPAKCHRHDNDIKRLIKSSVNKLTCVRVRDCCWCTATLFDRCPPIRSC